MVKLELARRPEPIQAPIAEPELNPALKVQLAELTDRMDRFERIVKDIRLEWDEMYDKFRLLYARASKRIKDAATVEPEAHQPLEDAPQLTIDRAQVVRRGGNYG